ncbi:small ribosomal subunit Rsm22 family protein [Amycolatopsis sp. H20-H5]|uniref:small ribosomal subunit Rsm22 family protein n=1 Tax=Amycolatopsis sp. H20-H5 TaxID=3046309 RepID=UPI002DBA64CA|nr:small ribosomal subunit Rsm22 family protein [Amycolatopsis sp. H20-H5]MEC3981791.1 small ribosomal subunit Rsm22 family protein [Amycolatopsis sp. H20-H5]
MALPDDLSSALDLELRRFPQHQLTQSVEKLTNRYRQGVAAKAPILTSDLDVAAYAAYRMPATYAAVHAVLAEVAARVPGFAPGTHVDVGGGTGAAVWAATGLWPSLKACTVVEQAANAIGLGKRLAVSATTPAVRAADWRRGLIDPSSAAPEADLVTLSYVLGELPENVRAEAVGWLAEKAGMVVLIEPGTPAGYERIVAARDQLIELGLSVVAPCPHDGTCPIPRGKDWCHFAARLPRTNLHRLIKAGALGFEDEKFSYVVASRTPAQRPAGRVVRHPGKRKGMVQFRLCTDENVLADVVVTKKHGDLYRAARDTEWGGPWPPDCP